MPQRAATIESLPMAFEVVKQMQADGLEWGEGYRPLGRLASAEIIEGRMAEAVDGWLDGLDGSAVRDRRNGSYSRHLLTELGDIALSVPRNQRFCPTGVLCRYARRAPEIDRAILAGFVLGLSTRKVGEVLLALLGRHRQPGRQDPERDGRRLPSPAARQRLQGPDARRRGARPQDRRRRPQKAGPGRPVHPARRPEGDRRLPPRRQRERRRVGALPDRPGPPRAHRRGDRDDLRRRRTGPDRRPSHRLSRHPLTALLGGPVEKARQV